MRPLSGRVRRAYFISFILLALALMPAVIFYADGWRFKSGFGFLRTGGIFVSAPYSDARISIDGKEVGSTSILSRGLYVDDLAPSSYEVTVAKEGYRTWTRVIIVEPQIVTDMLARLIPEEIEVDALLVTDAATSTPHISKATYDAYLSVFATKLIASSTVPVDESDSIALFIDHGTLIARWMNKDLPPSVFCGRPSYCVREFAVEDRADVTRAIFNRGEVIYRTSDGDIYLSEVDVRQHPQKVLLYAGKGADVSVIDGKVIIKHGKTLYQVGRL
jgi:hypothetical protein